MRPLLVSLLALALIGVSAVGQDVGTRDNPILMLLMPSMVDGEMPDIAMQIAEALFEVTGLFIEAVVLSDYTATVEAFASSDGNIFGLLPSSSYSMLNERTGGNATLRLIALLDEDQAPRWGGTTDSVVFGPGFPSDIEDLLVEAIWVHMESPEGFGLWSDRRLLGWTGLERVSSSGLSHVVFSMPQDPMYVGSFQRLSLDIAPLSGLSIDDLEFEIREGPAGGLVSMSRDTSYDPQNPEIMLLAGYRPGTYTLDAVEVASGDIVGLGHFQVTAQWDDDVEGPSQWVSGVFELPGVQGAAWGGGSPGAPENHNIIPAKGTNQVAILLVDTSTQRFVQSSVAALRTQWEDLAFNGQSINGKTVSTSHYYREASYGAFDFDGDVFGPVHLSGSWEDYFVKPEDSNQQHWKYKSSVWQACATAGDTLIDYSKYDHIVCVFQSITNVQTPQRAWPHADSMIAKVEEGDVALGTVVMHAEGGHSSLAATLAHELGHNLGLGDIYPWNGHPVEAQNRTPGHWALMAYQSGLPHPMLVHRMMLGWVQTPSLRLYNFQATTGYINETITLHAAELASPPSGSYSGIEIRIAEGWDYYFEYRASQALQIGDQNLPQSPRVIGTDVCFVDEIRWMNRGKPVMLLREDSDGDGPILDAGQDYSELDVTDPSFPTDFQLEVLTANATDATVQVRYGVLSQPDPSIRDWNPPVYQSPDIEVRNARSLADPKWRNCPWENHHNTLVARVTNRGAMNAPDVWVDFYVKDATVNAADRALKLIGSDRADVAAGATVEFSTIWMPRQAGHFCIEVRIRHYQTPGPNSKIEITEWNNIAHSNYDRFISESASAPERKQMELRVVNPFDEPVRVNLHVSRSTNPLYRTYLEHRWLTLQPLEVRHVAMMFEYVPADIWIPELEEFIPLPNNVSATAYLWLPDAPGKEAGVHLGGFSAEVSTGKGTRFASFWVDEPGCGGEVVEIGTGQPVFGGDVIVTMWFGEDEHNVLATVGLDGTFAAAIPTGWESIQAYYVPSAGLGASFSEVISRE